MSEEQEIHLQSPEEEDLIHRSTKKIKDGVSEVMDVELQGNNGDKGPILEKQPKTSYRDKVMEVDSNFDLEPAEIVRMVTEELFPDLDSSRNTEFGGKKFNLNPTVNVKLKEYESWCNPWNFCLIVRLMGKRVGFRFMNMKLRFDILASTSEDNHEPNVAKGKISQITKNSKVGLSGPSFTKSVNSKVPRPQTGNQNNQPTAQKKNATVLKDQLKGKEKNVVIKDSSVQIDNLHKEPSPMEIIDKQKKDDWEREVMAMMSRCHNKRWEAHSKGDYVGDLWSMDKSDFLEFLQGDSSSGSKGHAGNSDLGKPPDNNSMAENQLTHDGRGNNPVGFVAQPKGAGAKRFPGLVRDLGKLYQLKFIALLEPRISGSKADLAMKKMGFSGGVRVEAQGFSGGIWCMWKAEDMTVNVIKTSSQCIHFQLINVGGAIWTLTIVYASPNVQIYEDLWEELATFGNNLSDP
ncbi:hypothetical protein SESBI_01244 [Sesbania bispinosa]|nr:hypothetical protein SESBI_01244 [Sesbania bispinosa]